jgi:hypothetical protein
MSTDAHDHKRTIARRLPRRLLAHRGTRPLLVLAALAVAAIVLAACGSSSPGGAATSSASSSQAGVPRSNRFAAVRTCLQQQGINLPAPTGAPGQGPGGNGGRPGGFLKAPEGVSQAKFQEALKKCGARTLSHGGSRNLNNPTAVAALTKYAGCMRENGINLPAPNVTGTGPVFNTSGIETTSAAFKAAQEKCRADLPTAFGPGRGAGAGAPAA